MANEWQEVQLGGVADLITGYPFKSQHYTDDIAAARLIGGDNIAQGCLRWENVRRWPVELTDGLDAYWLKRGDVVLAMDRPWIEAGLKRAAIGEQDVPSLLVQRTARIRGSYELDNGFLRYVIGSQAFTQYILSVQTGTAVPHISPTQIRAYCFLLPPLEEQRAIAHILGTLDDKIELNRRANETLEAMARTLFKAWFVDFEPVRAKLDGRWQRGQSLPGLPAHLYDLFPNRIKESELGEIPEGWQIQSVQDIGEIICGKTPSTKVSEYYGDDIPFITIPEMHGNIFAIDVKRRLSHAGANSQQNKMLPQGAICVSCIATLGLVVITAEPSQTNQQINSVVPSEKGTTYYWYWVLKNLGDEIKAGGSGGSVLGNLSTGRFAELKVTASTEKLRLAYHAMVEALFSGIMESTRESRNLSQLRDTLLPKLISGELRVHDAERILRA